MNLEDFGARPGQPILELRAWGFKSFGYVLELKRNLKDFGARPGQPILELRACVWPPVRGMFAGNRRGEPRRMVQPFMVFFGFFGFRRRFFR